uniref:N-acetylneuraminate synthase family protein n=1 Tax=Algoriphagus sp. TaxID=1872435 RepID=UPI0040470C65
MRFHELNKTYIIAEIGVNHAGSVEVAKKMISAAKSSGADAVKFQTFTAEALVTHGTPKVKYQETTTSVYEDHFNMIKNLEFKNDDHPVIFDYCKSLDIDFISTPYDLESAKFLNDLGVTIFKVASADIVDLPLHRFLASTQKPVIIATGMATLGEIETVVNIYREFKNLNICLLHCVSNYPCSDESLNLRTMNTIAKSFQIPVGFSDHSVGDLASSLSIALGAKVVEKHFTLDKNLPGPDHKASSTPEEFASLVRMIRQTEVMLGSPFKRPQQEELQMSLVSRKSIVAKIEMQRGHIIRESDLTLKRPGTGIYSISLGDIVGKKLVRDIPANKLISWHDIEES